MAEEEINFDTEPSTGPSDEELNQEVNSEQFSNTPVGDQQKYDRPNLDGKEVKILSAKVTIIKKNNPVISAMSNPDIKYRKVQFLLTYDSKNKDGVNDREYISGAIQFQQRNGTFGQASFWNKGAKNQSALIWELVAKKKGKEPDKMSPKEFYDFLNSGITVKLKYIETKWKNEIYHKNLPIEIL